MAKHILDGVEGFLKRGGEIYLVDPLSIIVDDGWNERIDFTDTDGLKESIKNEGIKQPLEVRKGDDNRTHLVDGERRLRSTLELISEGCDIDRVPVTVAAKGKSEAELAVDAFLRNTGKPHNPFEEAGWFRKFKNWNYTEAEIAKRTGKSTQHVKNRLQLLNAAPAVRDAVIDGEISITTATEISKSPSIDAQTDAIHKSPRPHARKNIVIRYRDSEVKYSGAGKGMEFDAINDLLFNDNFMAQVEEAGFDFNSLKITIKPKQEVLWTNKKKPYHS